MTLAISVSSIIINGSPSAVTGTPSPKLSQRSDDMVYHGNYGITACGSQTQAVKDLLDLTYNLLMQAMDLLPSPVGNGGGSTVYNAFFNGVDPATVKALYQRMAAGTNVTIGGRSYNPTIVCVVENDPHILMRKVCLIIKLKDLIY